MEKDDEAGNDFRILAGQYAEEKGGQLMLMGYKEKAEELGHIVHHFAWWLDHRRIKAVYPPSPMDKDQTDRPPLGGGGG